MSDTGTRVIDMREVLKAFNEADEIMRKGAEMEGEKAFEAYSRAYTILEGKALPLTNYNLRARPHPEVAEAHFGLWSAAAFAAIMAGDFAKVLHASAMAMSGGPVDNDYLNTLACESYAKIMMTDPEAAEAQAEAKTKVMDAGIMPQARVKVSAQTNRTPVISLADFPPIYDPEETRILRTFGRDGGRTQDACLAAGAPGQAGFEEVLEKGFARIGERIGALEERISMLQASADGLAAAFRDKHGKSRLPAPTGL